MAKKPRERFPLLRQQPDLDLLCVVAQDGTERCRAGDGRQCQPLAFSAVVEPLERESEEREGAGFQPRGLDQLVDQRVVDRDTDESPRVANDRAERRRTRRMQDKAVAAEELRQRLVAAECAQENRHADS